MIKDTTLKSPNEGKIPNEENIIKEYCGEGNEVPKSPSDGANLVGSTKGELGRDGAGEGGRDTGLCRGATTSSLSLGALCVMLRAALRKWPK